MANLQDNHNIIFMSPFSAYLYRLAIINLHISSFAKQYWVSLYWNLLNFLTYHLVKTSNSLTFLFSMLMNFKNCQMSSLFYWHVVKLYNFVCECIYIYIYLHFVLNLFFEVYTSLFVYPTWTWKIKLKEIITSLQLNLSVFLSKIHKSQLEG